MQLTIEYLLIAPLIATIGGALLGVLVEAFVPRSARWVTQVIVAIAALGVALWFTVRSWIAGETQIAMQGSLSLDNMSYVVWAMLLVFGIGAVALAGERALNYGVSSFTPQGSATPGSQAERTALTNRNEHTEIFPLMLFSVTGMMILPAANDFITAFIGLEILSLPLYLLAGLARRSRLLSQEAALKYFLLGAMSSAIFLFGVVMLYGYSGPKPEGAAATGGTFEYAGIAAAIYQNVAPIALALAGVALVGVGLLFKVGAVPFHQWVPDVYTGSPTPISAFMAVCTKLAAIAALLRILYVPLGGLLWTWQTPLAVIAVVTMAVGAIFGLTQSNVKRLLAYSSISHAGFILVGIVAATTAVSGKMLGDIDSLSATWYYLAGYGLATMGAFAVVMCVRGRAGENPDLSGWAGFGRRNPALGVAMTIFLLSMAGIPLTGGFIGKVFSFGLAWNNGYQWLVVVALVFSLVTAAFYLRLIWTMFFVDPTEELEVAKPSVALSVVIGLCVLGTLAMGIVPGVFTDVFTAGTALLR
jgi:NADH-quinone oxidoreductase subunit N